ncbi:MAG: TonB-dependent receptor [Paludibacteraceae bacterium]|nr:TonB-dependent receptor [Paludibacteraceae bacterium]
MKFKRITTFLIAFLFVLNTSAQQTKENAISISFQNLALSDAIKKFESVSKCTFFYDASVVNVKQKVSLNVKDASLSQALKQLLLNTNIRFEIKDSEIILFPDKPTETGNKKSKKIAGKVVDQNGEPLIGVNIRVKGSDVGTISDVNGEYSLQSGANDVIVVTYVGYNPKEYSAAILGEGSQIVLDETSQQMKEVMVVAYGTQKRASVVGAITSVEPGKLNISATRSLSNNLAGNVAGIIGVQRSGEPGYDNSEFWIRGISSFRGSQTPLVLVDGIERSLNDIDIAEIETFSVLKDASASAVYGVRGANGVILITTKRGFAGKTNINVSVEHSVTQPAQLPQFLNAANYVTLMNNINIQDLGYQLYSDDVVEKYRNGYDRELYPDVNWIDAITNNNANNTRASFDLSGGNEKLRYSFVGAYYSETGITTSDPTKQWNSEINLNRFNLRTNVDMNVTSTTLLTFNIGGYLQRRNAPSASIDNVFSKAFQTPPHIVPEKYMDGKIARPKGGDNPWAMLTQTGFQREAKSKLESLFAIEQDLKFLLPGLKAKGIFSFDYFSLNGVKRSGEPVYYTAAIGRDAETGELLFSDPASDGQEFLNYEQWSNYGSNSTYFEANLSYDHTFDDDHYVNALILYNQRDYDDGAQVPYRNQGFAGRAAYTYKGRYIAEFNFGYNGSENFAPNKRFGFFPSVATGWIVSEEPFMASVRNIFSKTKIRASYGLVGNDKLDGRRFAYITTIGSSNGYRFGNSSLFYDRSGRREGDIGVPDLTWETVKKTNLGLELGLWNMIEIQADYFHERREDIFMQRRNYPNSAGFATLPWANFGIVENQGVDFQLTLNKQVNKDWFVSAKGSATYAKNKIIEQDEDIMVVGTHRSSTGKPAGQIFGLIADGLFSADDFVDLSTGELQPDIPVHKFTDRVYPGDIKYRDLDNDNEITLKDMTAIGGTENPEFVYGFGLNTTYKRVDFGFFFQGNGRTYRMIGRGNNFLPGAALGATGNIFTNATDAWTEDNPREDVFYPRLHMGYNANNAQASSWWLKDMSLLRLKNVEIGYSAPKRMLANTPFEYGRIFVRATNLFHLSGFKLWDPELSTDNGLKYPIMSTISMGLQIRL